jgi:hypothetical protein
MGAELLPSPTRGGQTRLIRPAGACQKSVRFAMTIETEAVGIAVADLTHAMSRLVKAIDDVGDDREANRHIPETLPAALERLVTRISAAQGFAD